MHFLLFKKHFVFLFPMAPLPFSVEKIFTFWWVLAEVRTPDPRMMDTPKDMEGSRTLWSQLHTGSYTS